MEIRVWKHQSLKLRLWGVLCGFAGIADGLVTVFSAASLASNFEIRAASHRAKLFAKEYPVKKGNK